jgi:S-adenosylmethionine:tRNA ribosyltransferase-isomerase
VLIERPARPHEALAQIRASKPPRRAAGCGWKTALRSEVLGREGELLPAALSRRGTWSPCSNGTASCRCRPTSSAPASVADEERYQTVYAREPARSPRPPPACISTTPAGALRARASQFACHLHVGAGTFQPVRVDGPGRAPHAQRALRGPELRHRARRAPGGRVIAVGTTSLRAWKRPPQDGG